MKKRYFILLLAILPLLCWGQSQSKVAAPVAYWPELQVSLKTGQSSILFFRNQYRINSDSRYNDLRDSGLFSGFERVELTLGYEHTFSEHWRGGALVRYAEEDFPETVFYTLFMRHNGNIRSLYFNTQGKFEYTTREQQDDFGRYSLAAEIGKKIPLKGKSLTPSLSYDMMLVSSFAKESRTADERMIDRTRLRLNLSYALTEKLRITPYFMRQTDYYYVLVPPKYDANNQLLERGYTAKRNRISPVLGLELKYAINLQPETASFTY
jgi:hypothetical protein